MAFEAYCKIPGITGESTAAGFEGQTALTSVQWSASQAGSMQQATGGGVSSANLSDLTYTHYMDSSSPAIFQACVTGQHFATVTICVRKAGGDALVYCTYTLTDCIISGISWSGGGGDNDLITQHTSVNFAQFQIEYQPQDKTGAKKGGSVKAGYNAALRKKI